MKFVTYFSDFMRNTVNINQTRLDNLEGAVNSIYEAIEADDTFGPMVLGKDPQGSWKHKTIIKPLEGHEFDADVMLLVEEDSEWSEHPATYIDELNAALKRNENYKPMLKPPKCRCVRVVYANVFHIDIVPTLTLNGDRQVIVNRDEDEWEDTDPEGFTKWMKAKDTISGGHLREVIRLFKYVRDHRKGFTSTRSAILTAILGERVEDSKKDADADYYGDLPTTLYHIGIDLNEWLKTNPTKPSIPDPSGATDPSGVAINFDHRWTETDYQTFRSNTESIVTDIRDAFEEEDPTRSLELWQKVFGSEFKAPKRESGRLTGPEAPTAATVPTVQTGRAG